MMSTIRATALSLIRNPIAMVWTLLFPILLSTIFLFMFSSFENDGTIDPVPVAAVADEAWEESPFSLVAESLGEGEDRMIDVVEAAREDEALALLASGSVDGIFRIDGTGELRLTVAPEFSAAHQGERTRSYGVNRSILEVIASSYTQSEALIAEIAAEDPALLANADEVEHALSLDASGTRVSLTRSAPDESVRYYYALLGMAVLFASQLGMFAVSGIRPSASAVAARRSVAGTSRLRQLTGAAVASWALSFAFLSVAFLFIRFVVGVDFGGREALCFVAIAVGSLLATGMGAFVGSLPLRGAAAGAGLLTGITCVLSLFAGLFGEPAMQLADEVARAVPLSAWLNPAKLVCDTFHCLYFYESLAPFALRLAACAAWGLALLGIAIVVFRRQNHASR